MDSEIEGCIRSEYARIVGVVCLVTGSAELAEEAVQDAFALAVERSRAGQQVRHLGAWVVTVALNRARSGRRRQAAERRALQRLEGPSIAVVGADPDVGLVVRSALAELAGRQKEAAVLYYFLDLSVDDVAAVLGVSAGTVKTALSRARVRLAQLLDEREVDA